MTTRDCFLGCLLGLAVGDAVGTTLEFEPRGSFTPINDLVGGGPFRLRPGQWTDDTSMALCLACMSASAARACTSSSLRRTRLCSGLDWHDPTRSSRAFPPPGDGYRKLAANSRATFRPRRSAAAQTPDLTGS
jgi:hypothetical protein